MDPYQAWRRGLISYSTYLEKKNQTNIDISENETSAIVLIGNMNIRENETWEVRDQETAIAYIGPTYDMENEGTMNIYGDILLYTAGKGLRVSGTTNVTGTINIKEF